MTPFTIGADPELFLVDPHNNFISAIGLIGGTKRKPLDIGQGCAVQEDNVAVEFNIPPASTVEAFIASTQYAMDSIAQRVKERNLLLSITASKVFSNEQLAHPEARVFGCDPDYNAWTKKVNPAPHAKDPNLRSAGGHVHIGCMLDKVQLIRWCDVFLGLNSVFEDEDRERRQLYGKAGAFRSGKGYQGVEYRTLSNYWLKTEDFMRAVYHRVENVVNKVSNGRTLTEKDGELIQKAINTSDKELAAMLLAEHAA